MKNFKEKLRAEIIKLSSTYKKGKLYYILIDSKREYYETICSENNALKRTIAYWIKKYSDVKIINKKYGIYVINCNTSLTIFYPTKPIEISLNNSFDDVDSVLDIIMKNIPSNSILDIDDIIHFISLSVYNNNCYFTIDFKKNHLIHPEPFINTKYSDIALLIPTKCLNDMPNLKFKETRYGVYWYSLSYNMMGFIPRYLPHKTRTKKYVEGLHICIKNDVDSIIRKLSKPSQLKLF